MEQYEKFVLDRCRYPGHGTFAGLEYTMLALGGESGEAQNEVKKSIRDEASTLTPDRRRRILLELGDVLWYLVAAANELGASLLQVAAMNEVKLIRRDEEKKPIG